MVYTLTSLLCFSATLEHLHTPATNNPQTIFSRNTLNVLDAVQVLQVPVRKTLQLFLFQSSRNWGLVFCFTLFLEAGSFLQGSIDWPGIHYFHLDGLKLVKPLLTTSVSRALPQPSWFLFSSNKIRKKQQWLHCELQERGPLRTPALSAVCREACLPALPKDLLFSHCKRQVVGYYRSICQRKKIMCACIYYHGTHEG